MNNSEKPALTAEASFQAEALVQEEASLKKPRKPRAKKAEVEASTPAQAEEIEGMAKGLTKASTQAKPASASKRSAKTTALGKKTTDASKK